MLSLLRRHYRRSLFDPGWSAVLTNPFYFARKGLFVEIARLSDLVRGRVLDVGCGQRPYERLFTCDAYVGLDLDTPRMRAMGKADHFYDGTTFPFPDAAFDTVVSNQVLEHVFNPEEFCRELRRVLRPEGRLLLTVPFVWDEHEQPIDYARYTSFGLAHLLEGAGFRIVEDRKTLPDGRLLFQLLAGMLYKRHQHRPTWVRGLVQLTLIAPVTLAGVVGGRLIRGNGDLFLDHVVLAEKANLDA